jgi:2-polyprenyl-6-methoxyphenol hydroxylase-like FAD-dependent oxidoreductase
MLDNEIDKRKKLGHVLPGHRACVVGAGPVGLRCAVELALVGADVTLVEQRRAFTRAAAGPRRRAYRRSLFRRGVRV